MSYILDALRRAEADRERERGQVPGLHTQPLSGSEAAPAAGGRGWLPWAGGGLLLVAGMGAGVWWASGPLEAPTPPASQAAPVPPATPTQSAQTSMQAVTQTADSGARPQPAASGSPFLPPAPPPEAVATAPLVAPVVAAKQAAPTRSAPPTPVPASAADARIPRLSELPESTRRELPRLAISGSVYSEQPASRFVIINGEVAREGANLGADLVLEEIRSHELVLRFKGQRYRQPV
jgi:general secretion pathway protein B